MTTHNATGWDGTLASLPDDTVLGTTKRQWLSSLESLMRRACLLGWHVTVVADPYRDHNCFSVLVGRSMLPQEATETDDPRGFLEALLNDPNPAAVSDPDGEDGVHESLPK